MGGHWEGIQAVMTEVGPLLTLDVHKRLAEASRAGGGEVQCSLDLDRSTTTICVGGDAWTYLGVTFPMMPACRDRTIYYWNGSEFGPVARYDGALIKLVPTQWGAPTFEIDGIKMLPTQKVSPFDDARTKVGLIEPKGKRILDTCGGLGYFAAHCLEGGAQHVTSFEKHPTVVWLRSLNPWSPEHLHKGDPRLQLTQASVLDHIGAFESQSFDALLHDPPRFGIAGELYAQSFYDELARVLKRRGKLFHYTGSPNRLTTGRDVPNEVATRLKRAGFHTQLIGDGVLAIKR